MGRRGEGLGSVLISKTEFKKDVRESLTSHAKTWGIRIRNLAAPAFAQPDGLEITAKNGFDSECCRLSRIEL